jgi:peptide/nickel transport system substrate-binding protein
MSPRLRFGSPKVMAVITGSLVMLLALACGSAEQPAPAAPAPPAPAPTAPAPAVQPTQAPAPAAPAAPTAAPAPAAPAAPAAQQSGTLRVAVDNVGTPIFLNRDAVFPDNMIPYSYGITETLAMYSKTEGGETCEAPMLATKWEVAPDQSKVTFTLRQGVHIRSFGKDWGEMTAEDVVWSMNDSFIPESKHSSAGEMAATFKPWQVVDTHTVEAPFNTFRGDFIDDNTVSMCSDSVSVLSKKMFDELGPDQMRTTPHGTGPFVVKNWLPRERIEAEAVPDHWRQTPAFKDLVIVEAPEGSVRTAMLRAGEADLAPVPLPDVPTLQQEGIEFNEGLRQFLGHFLYFAGNYWADKAPETGEPVERQRPDLPWIGNPFAPGCDAERLVNSIEVPQGDICDSMERARKVRLAMSMAIDRETISETVLAGFGGPIYTGGAGLTVHQNHPEWKDKWTIPFDPQQAQQLMQEAGYPNGFELELYCPVDIGISEEVCLSVGGMWQEYLGLVVKLDTTAYTARRPTMVGRSITSVWIAPWGANREDDTEPGGTCSCRIFPEPTGGYNPGLEAPIMYEHYTLTSGQERASPENLAAREKAMDWADFWRVTAGIVEVPTLIGVNPDKVTSWELQPLRFINNFESIALKE